MSRPIWKGHISFGLVHIPVSLYAAEQRNDLHLKMVDSRNNSGIRYERVNEVTGKEVPWDQIVKGYEYDDGKFILLSEDDLKKAAPEATQSIDIDSFVPTESIAPQYFDTPYYLVPAKRSEKPYALLREALRKSGRTGIAKVVIRTRQYLAAISVRDKALILDLLRFHQELRDAPEDKLPALSLKELKISEKELEMAEQLIDTMESEWKPEQYKDEYRETLMKWIHQQIEGGESTTVGEAEETEEKEDGKVIDMMALLKQSMEKHAESKKTASAPKKRKKA
jgi:DNA end-binding protein Ku